MEGITVTIYDNKDSLPELECNSFFHGRTLFEICSSTSRMHPYMVVARDDGGVVAHMLAMVRSKTSLLPSCMSSHCCILGEGEYREGSAWPKALLFGEMMSALTAMLDGRVLYIELSNLSVKMFGYKQLCEAGYFPVHWMNVHNSLHSKLPEERLAVKVARRIEASYNKGVVTAEVSSDSELEAFCRLLRSHNRFKLKRYIPRDDFFRGLWCTEHGRLFVTKYKDRVVGCCACVYSEGNAYLWYFAFLRKSFVMVCPDVMTVWHAIKHAHSHGCTHIHFMDVGLPFRKNPFREFILRFGGKPVSTYRWFRFSARWLNTLMSLVYRG